MLWIHSLFSGAPSLCSAITGGSGCNFCTSALCSRSSFSQFCHFLPGDCPRLHIYLHVSGENQSYQGQWLMDYITHHVRVDWASWLHLFRFSIHVYVKSAKDNDIQAHQFWTSVFIRVVVRPMFLLAPSAPPLVWLNEPLHWLTGLKTFLIKVNKIVLSPISHVTLPLTKLRHSFA